MNINNYENIEENEKPCFGLMSDEDYDYYCKMNNPYYY